MTIALGVMAALLFLMYASYFIHILKGRPQEFELEIMKALASWMVHRGAASKGQLWGLFVLSIFLEVIYFLIAFHFLSNPVMKYFTVAFAAAEFFHFLNLGLSFRRFFSGHSRISEIFNWRMERISAALFFNYSLLVIISLLFFA